MLSAARPDPRRRRALPGRHRTLRWLLGERVVRITVKPFMDVGALPLRPPADAAT
ncbi:MAG: hypothetical protein ACT4NY_14270 [Pseudonocardiales bacterium]